MSWEKARKAAPLVLAAATVLGMASALALIAAPGQGDWLGFVPMRWRSGWESVLGLAAPAGDVRRSWQIASSFPLAGWGWWPLLAALALAVGYLAWPRGTRAMGIWLAASRLSVFALLIGFMLPGWTLTIEESELPRLNVVVDTSGSMRTRDARSPAGKPISRLEAARAALLDERGGLAPHAWRADPFRIQLHAIGAECRQLGAFGPGDEERARAGLQGLRADGEGSLLGDHLAQLASGALDGPIVVLTDGIVTNGQSLVEAARLARARRIPTYFVPVGDPTPRPSIALGGLRVPDWVQVGEEIVVEVEASLRDAPPREQAWTARVLLEEDGAALPRAAATVTLNPSGRPGKVVLRHRPLEAGAKTFQVTATRAGGVDASLREETRGPRGTILVLPPRPLGVLLVDGAPSYSWRTLRSRLPRFAVADRPLFATRPILVDDAAVNWREELEGIDVVVWGDLGMPEGVAVELERFIAKGGGLVVVAGPRCGYWDLARRGLLPVTLDEARELGRGRIEKRGLIAHPSSRLAAAAGALEEPWLQWFASDVAPHSWAEVHARLNDPGGSPALVEGRIGQGAVVYLATDETWRWQAAGKEEAYDRFWAAVLRGAANGVGGQPRMRLDRQHEYLVGETCTIVVEWPAARPEAAVEAMTLLARHRPPGGQEYDPPRAIRLERTPGSPRLLEARLGPLAAGEYVVSLPRSDGQIPVEARLRVQASAKEEEGIPCRLEELRQAAYASGGQLLPLDGLAELRNVLADAPTASVRLREIAAWNHPLGWGLVLLLLSGDWAARRWLG